MGSLPRTKRGYNYILIVADIFSKFVLAFPLRKATAKHIVELLETQVLLLFGLPKLISENRVLFRSREHYDFLKSYEFRSCSFSFYHS